MSQITPSRKQSKKYTDGHQLTQPCAFLICLSQRRIADEGSAETLPFDAERFDRVACTLTLCSIPDVQAALSEVLRVLKPGGDWPDFSRYLSRRQSSCEESISRRSEAIASTPSTFWVRRLA
jgi:ubiquinone/menaquinone biosynthesis C-methylase UbiE